MGRLKIEVILILLWWIIIYIIISPLFASYKWHNIQYNLIMHIIKRNHECKYINTLFVRKLGRKAYLFTRPRCLKLFKLNDIVSISYANIRIAVCYLVATKVLITEPCFSLRKFSFIRHWRRVIVKRGRFICSEKELYCMV